MRVGDAARQAVVGAFVQAARELKLGDGSDETAPAPAGKVGQVTTSRPRADAKRMLARRQSDRLSRMERCERCHIRVNSRICSTIDAYQDGHDWIPLIL